MNTFGIKQKFTTPYHPQSNGMCERFNKTLKEMLSKVGNDDPKNWDSTLPSLLFAYREISHDSTGDFSPFELMFGANPRGPLSILKESLVKPNENAEKTSYDIVTNTREHIIKACQEAGKNADNTNLRAPNRINQNRKLGNLEPGDKVLVLLQNKNNKLFIEWLGPYEVMRKITDVDYEIKIKGQLNIFHIDMLKQYYDKPVETAAENMCLNLVAEEGE